MRVLIELGNRLTAHLSCDYDEDVNRRVKSYPGTRWCQGYWSVPLLSLEALTAELAGAGHDVVVQREEAAS